jgi:hypothetical protein
MPGSKFAAGSIAWGDCLRCGLRFYLRDLTFDGYMPGLRVCIDCYDSKQPQEFLVDVTDPQALWKPAPDEVAFTAPVLTLDDANLPPNLSWTSADFQAYTVGGYSVYRAIPGSPFTLLATFLNQENIYNNGQPGLIETLAYADTTALFGVTYQYYVLAFSLTGELGPTDQTGTD